LLEEKQVQYEQEEEELKQGIRIRS